MTVIGDRTRDRREELGLSQPELAKRVGVKQQAISQLESGETKRPRYLADLARELGTTIDWLQGRSDAREELTVADLSNIQVRGFVQAGHWRESLEWPEDEWYPVAMPVEDHRYPGARLFGLEVRGASMNKVFPEGTVLACIHLIQYPVNVTPGKYVIVERVSETGEIEATVKQIEVDEDGKAWLWPRSNDPRYQTPIPINDGVVVRITALVVRSSKPE